MTATFDEVFVRLREMMLAAASHMKVMRDEPGALELRTPELDPKTKQLGWYGTVTIKKSYVAVHLMPLYIHPQMAQNVSPELAKRRQGKTCFNFSKIDEALFAELNTLMMRCAHN